MTKGFRARVGSQRITKNLNPLEANYTRQIRAQMKEIEKNLSAVIAQLEGVTPEVLEIALRPTFSKAKRYTPKDTGALVESGYLQVSGSGTSIKAEIGFAKGGNPHYAVYVHEILSYNHDAPTRAKFLQSALEEDANAIPNRLLMAYRSMIGM